MACQASASMAKALELWFWKWCNSTRYSQFESTNICVCFMLLPLLQGKQYPRVYHVVDKLINWDKMKSSVDRHIFPWKKLDSSPCRSQPWNTCQRKCQWQLLNQDSSKVVWGCFCDQQLCFSLACFVCFCALIKVSGLNRIAKPMTLRPESAYIHVFSQYKLHSYLGCPNMPETQLNKHLILSLNLSPAWMTLQKLSTQRNATQRKRVCFYVSSAVLTSYQGH